MTLTAMEILERCRRAEGEKRRLKERADMIRDTAGHMTASLDGIGARSTGENDHMLTMVEMLDSVEQELAQRDREYTAEVAAACQLLDMLPPMECSVLSRYYIRGQTLRSIARDMGYSYSYVSRCKGHLHEGCGLCRTKAGYRSRLTNRVYNDNKRVYHDNKKVYDDNKRVYE